MSEKLQQRDISQHFDHIEEGDWPLTDETARKFNLDTDIELVINGQTIVTSPDNPNLSRLIEAAEREMGM